MNVRNPLKILGWSCLAGIGWTLGCTGTGIALAVLQEMYDDRRIRARLTSKHRHMWDELTGRWRRATAP